MSDLLEKILLQLPPVNATIFEKIKTSLELFEDETGEIHIVKSLTIVLLFFACVIALIECVRGWRDDKRYKFQNEQQMQLHAVQDEDVL